MLITLVVIGPQGQGGSTSTYHWDIKGCVGTAGSGYSSIVSTMNES